MCGAFIFNPPVEKPMDLRSKSDQNKYPGIIFYEIYIGFINCICFYSLL